MQAKDQTTTKITLEIIEDLVVERTLELNESKQRLIEQQEKMIYSSKLSALGEIAGGVAHEINTPLTVIGMRVELLIERFIKRPDEDPNTLNNSYDAISSLKDKWIRIELKKENNYLVIKFTDSGEGISKELHDKIMLPFFTTKEIGKDTELGLSISQGIIEKHRGKLTIVENSPNTSFLITLSISRHV